ncbi:MAG TPA: histidine--tRNA ligase [Candidatus Paceibacterota bacterium]|jgi:histidyl-tRNA synthetase|nr:histidine--tRNA ligase [Candidatus Paceibacterota bacterium]HJN62640.1 histidine--tRNA ligase [Candidatus Paceibacterota bacterium]|tara:strand:+ start:653 stop:1936 length:1284 start_codon:yes stop_codon:yes gene_type:complete
MANLSKEPYKGVRDFYPKDKALQNYIFEKWAKVCRSFGYEEMGASILEPTELYEAKTGEEIINEQTYTFTDRGDRRVTMRPEMTPTVARMVAAKKRELNFPLRWYSIANFFRYERPQKGRTREFYQLNCDLFGTSGADADFEILNLAYSLMKEIGAEDNNFEIRINNRKFINFLLKDYLSLNEENVSKLMKLIDKKNKMPNSEFMEQAKLILNDKVENFLEILESRDLNELNQFSDNEGVKEMKAVFKKLNEAGIKNYRYEPTLMRGLDYYTGLVFELWDTGKGNNRSLFGGGRYDDLLEIFGEEKLPTTGFAVSDVVIENYLKTYNLIPEYTSSTDLFICTLDESFISKANDLAKILRGEGLNIVVNLSLKKVGDQISLANKKSIPFVICIGEIEVNSGKYKVKNLKSGEEKELGAEEISGFVKNA